MNKKGYIWILVATAIILTTTIILYENNTQNNDDNFTEVITKDAAKISMYEITLTKAAWDCNWAKEINEIETCITIHSENILNQQLNGVCTQTGIVVNKLTSPKQATIILNCQRNFMEPKENKYQLTKNIIIKNKPDFLDKKLLLWLRMNGKLVDTSPTPNNILEINANQTIGIEEIEKTAYSFDGNQDYITINNNPDLNISGSITISAWINPIQPTTAWSSLIYKGDDTTLERNYAIWINKEGYLHWTYNISGTNKTLSSSEDSIQFGEWQHIAVTRNLTTGIAKIYINGINKASITHSTGTHQVFSNPLYLGKSGAELYIQIQDYKGIIDEVMIFGQELNATDINAIYNYTKPI